MEGKEWAQITFFTLASTNHSAQQLRTTASGACNLDLNPGSAACRLDMCRWAIYSWVCLPVCPSVN